MTVGLPGVGIGGIFYIASALLMPMRSLAAVLTGRAHLARWPVALRQAAIAIAILGVLWATGLTLGWIITTAFPAAAVAGVSGATPAHVRSVVRTSALLLSFGTLAVVLAVVQLLRVALPVRPTVRSATAERRDSARPAA